MTNYQRKRNVGTVFQYEPADKFFVVNDEDPHLRPIVISLPEPPPIHMIDGHGLAPENQRFQRLEPPDRLVYLEKKVIREQNEKSRDKVNFTVSGYSLYKDLWEQMEEDVEYYAPAISYIRMMWYYMVNGYWCFIHGKPTYIDPWHFHYLHFFYLVESGCYPDYRDRDRRWFHFNWYGYTTTETFAHTNAHGEAIKKNGKYEMVDLGVKVCEGTENTKGRRMGDTLKGLSIGDWIIKTIKAAQAGIISFGGEGSESAFKKKYVPAWQRQPLWLKPAYRNIQNPTKIEYNTPPNIIGEDRLESIYDFATTASEQFYDSKKLNYLFSDEDGKQTRQDVNSKWGTLRYCLREGEEIVGFSVHPTTVEDMETGGGQEFFEMMGNGNFYTRDKSGRTRNGLFRVFFRASDGRKGSMDSYGASVEFVPTEAQEKEGMKRGAFDMLRREREVYLKSGKPSDMKLFRQHQRKNPIYYMDSFVSEAADLGFDYAILGEAIARARTTGDAKRYDIAVDTSNPDGPRHLVRTDSGKFEVSIDFPMSLWNQRVKELAYDNISNEYNDMWRPLNTTRFVASADPVDFVSNRRTRSQKDLSKAAGGILELRRTGDDSDDPRLWEGDQVVVTYINTPTSMDEYGDDMINMCVLFGAMMYPERNKTLINSHFEKRGYGGYLLYDLDDRGRAKTDAGWYANADNKQKGFTMIRDWIAFRAHKCNHIELLEQLNNIRSIDEMTRYDLVAVLCGMKLGSMSRYGEAIERFSEVEINMNEFINTF